MPRSWSAGAVWPDLPGASPATWRADDVVKPSTRVKLEDKEKRGCNFCGPLFGEVTLGLMRYLVAPNRAANRARTVLRTAAAHCCAYCAAERLARHSRAHGYRERARLYRGTRRGTGCRGITRKSGAWPEWRSLLLTVG